jgi:hypothetical protein
MKKIFYHCSLDFGQIFSFIQEIFQVTVKTILSYQMESAGVDKPTIKINNILMPF